MNRLLPYSLWLALLAAPAAEADVFAHGGQCLANSGGRAVMAPCSMSRHNNNIRYIANENVFFGQLQQAFQPRRDLGVEHAGEHVAVQGDVVQAEHGRPGRLRHALGEYYTPAWLVDHVLDLLEQLPATLKTRFMG